MDLLLHILILAGTNEQDNMSLCSWLFSRSSSPEAEVVVAPPVLPTPEIVVEEPPLVMSGGFGDVRFETRNGMRVAVKTAQGDGNVQYEAHMMSCLRHPFIPVVLTSSPNEIVMADLGRQSLTEVLQTGRLWRNEYDKVAWCVASALAYMHNHFFHHSDVKCDNVVVDSFGDAILIDYNLATYAPSGMSYSRCGSRAYVPPEVYHNHAPWDAFAADVWSYSILYFAILYRHHPFDDAYSAYARYALLHPYHGSIESLRVVWSGSTLFDRGDVKKMHVTTLDRMMQPIRSSRRLAPSSEDPIRYSMLGANGTVPPGIISLVSIKR